MHCVCAAQQHTQPVAPPVPPRGPRNQQEETSIVSSYCVIQCIHSINVTVINLVAQCRGCPALFFLCHILLSRGRAYC